MKPALNRTNVLRSVAPVLFLLAQSAALAQGVATPVPGWPQVVVSVGDPVVSVCDIDADGVAEIIVPTGSGPQVFNADGTVGASWTGVSGCLAKLHVAVGNLTGDDKLEIVWHCSGGGNPTFNAVDHAASPIPGWPYSLSVPTAPAVPLVSSTNPYFALGDIDGDNYDELVFLTRESYQQVYAVDGDGSIVPGWPQPLNFPSWYTANQSFLSGLAVADVDFDGVSEVIVTYVGVINGVGNDNSPVWLFNGDGSLRPGWPLGTTPGGPLANPAVADLDGDFSPELVLSGLYLAHAYGPDGTKRFRTALPSSTLRYVTLGDLENDGPMEIILGGVELSIVKVDVDSPLIPRPLVLHATTSTADPYSVYQGVSLGDMNGDGNLEIAAWSEIDSTNPSTNHWQVHVLDTAFNELPGWPKVHAPPVNPSDTASTTMVDLDGDGDAELLYMYDGSVFVWNSLQWAPLTEVPFGASVATTHRAALTTTECVPRNPTTSEATGTAMAAST